MKGLVIVKLKKYCLDLPEKQFKIITVKPTIETLQAAKLIRTMHDRAITVLSKLRELSDGFQYVEVQTGEKTCDSCHGTGEVQIPVPGTELTNCGPLDVRKCNFESKLSKCELCGGSGKINSYTRESKDVGTPKDRALIEMLDQHEDVGRLVVWGGFTGTIDRIMRIALQQGWTVLRVDGRGYFARNMQNDILDADELLDAMDLSHPNYSKMLIKHPKLVFIGHPKAGGMGLNLTASPSAVYYSNDFDGEAKMQSIDRIHRAGMDLNRACTIYEFIHLPSDQVVLDNLNKKVHLQNLSLGEIENAFL